MLHIVETTESVGFFVLDLTLCPFSDSCRLREISFLFLSSWAHSFKSLLYFVEVVLVLLYKDTSLGSTFSMESLSWYLGQNKQ